MNYPLQATSAVPDPGNNGITTMPTDPLAALRPLHAPEAISWWPPAPGWWIVAALMLIIFTLVIVFLWRHWKNNRYRRHALREATQIKQHYAQQPLQYCQQINQLLKRIGVHVWPKTLTASLTGTAWLEFLNAQCKRQVFSQTSITLLGQSAYQAEADISPAAIDNLHNQVMQWIKQHRRSMNSSHPRKPVSHSSTSKDSGFSQNNASKSLPEKAI